MLAQSTVQRVSQSCVAGVRRRSQHPLTDAYDGQTSCAQVLRYS